MKTNGRNGTTATVVIVLGLLASAACNGDPSTTDAAGDAGDVPDVAAEADATDGRIDTPAEEGIADGEADGGGPEEVIAEDATDVPPEVEADATDVPPEVAEDVTDVPADGEEDAADGSDGGPEDSSLLPCPDDMVPSGTICIDRYEASRPDATATSPGADDSRATSRPGVLPWFVNPMTSAAFAAFEAACAAAGKRLCSADEWRAACAGASDAPYVYGATFDREVCNCVDTFCDDWCADHGIPAGECDTAADCGYRYGCLRMLPTGSMPGCTNELGHLDINGNVWEIVRSTADARGFEIRGGAFNCAMAAYRVGCTFNAGWADLYAGFRCCKDR